MAIYTNPIELNAQKGITTGDTEKVGKRGKKRFYLNSTKEGQDWSIFAPDSKSLDRTEEHFVEHGVEQRGDQQLMYVDIGVRDKSPAPPESADGLEKKSLADLRTLAVQVGVTESALMAKPQLIEAIRAKGNTYGGVDRTKSTSK